MSKTLSSLLDLRGLNQLCAGNNILILSGSYDRMVETLAHRANHITLQGPEANTAGVTKALANQSGINIITFTINLAEDLGYGDNQFDRLLAKHITHTLSDLWQRL